VYDARQIANWFILRAASDGRKLSIMQLLKLVFLSHGWYLEMRKRPLFLNRVEAWRHGPVVPEVYAEFRKPGPSGIYVSESSAAWNADEITLTDQRVLEEVYRIYGQLSPFRLSDLTHEPNGPWDQATSLWGYFAPITNDLIQSHYEMKRKASQI
jgi:uncharacterized phage-associated protein